MFGTPRTCRKGFSLLELIIVVVIIGIIAAIAVPRMSRGSGGGAQSALAGNLAVLRNAIDLFAIEHNGTYPTRANIENQLMLYSDVSSNTNATKTAVFMYGPYIRKIPPLPVGAKKGATGISDADAAGVGWIYDKTTGQIRSNTLDTELDDTHTKYNEY